MKTPSLVEHLSVIKDFRQDWKIEHKLTDVLLLAICAVICGAEGWDEIEDFGEAKQDFLRSYGDFEAGIPSADTIARVVDMISPKQFQRVFADWIQECHTVSAGEVIAIDGKTLRKGAIQMHKVATYEGDSYSIQEKSHGRLETRHHIVSDLPDSFFDFTYEWAGLKKLGVVVSFRQEGDQIPENAMVRYYTSSKDLSARELADAALQHWYIETKLHWCLDVGMNEDACRIRRDMASENLAGIRHIAMNYLKSETSFKAGIKRKQKKAAMSESYLATILAA